MKKLISILILGLLLSTLVGCQSKDYVAKVNDKVITQEEFDKRSSQVASTEGINLEDPQFASVKDFFKLQILSQMIDETLLVGEAEKRGFKADSKVVDEKIETLKKTFNSEEEYKKFYKEKFQMDEKEIKDLISRSLILEELYKDVTKDIKSVDVDLEAYYNEHKNEYFQPEKVKARHILVETEEEAKNIIKQITEEDKDMAELAQEKSIEPAAKQTQGDLGYFTKDKMIKEFSDAAFALNVGEITKTPVKTGYGFHVIRVEDKLKERQVPFSEAKDDIEKKLIEQAKAEKFAQFVEELRSGAKIENKLEKEIQERIEKEKASSETKDSEQSKETQENQADSTEKAEQQNK